MTEHKLLVVGGRIQTLRKAAALGIRFVLIQHKDQFVPEAAALAEAVLIADYTDWDVTRPLVEAAQQAYGFTRVASITEPGLVPAGRISDHLGLGNTSEEVAELLRDKHAMRRHLAASPSPQVRALSVAAAEVGSAEALTAFGDEHGYPFVLKPVDATASLGVVRIDGPEQAAEAWAGVEALRARTDLQWGAFFTIGRFIAEQYIPGPEYSVESFSFAGRHIVLAVTEKPRAAGSSSSGTPCRPASTRRTSGASRRPSTASWTRWASPTEPPTPSCGCPRRARRSSRATTAWAATGSSTCWTRPTASTSKSGSWPGSSGWSRPSPSAPSPAVRRPPASCPPSRARSWRSRARTRPGPCPTSSTWRPACGPATPSGSCAATGTGSARCWSPGRTPRRPSPPPSG